MKHNIAQQGGACIPQALSEYKEELAYACKKCGCCGTAEQDDYSGI